MVRSLWSILTPLNVLILGGIGLAGYGAYCGNADGRCTLVVKDGVTIGGAVGAGLLAFAESNTPEDQRGWRARWDQLCCGFSFFNRPHSLMAMFSFAFVAICVQCVQAQVKHKEEGDDAVLIGMAVFYAICGIGMATSEWTTDAEGRTWAARFSSFKNGFSTLPDAFSSTLIFSLISSVTLCGCLIGYSVGPQIWGLRAVWIGLSIGSAGLLLISAPVAIYLGRRCWLQRREAA
ncbi:hypothetical protein AURDEDRAFT_117458 [Auricularia subglabra TFB-10046 SS5]|nr:hypothetical protein AURDEDRAFT_117458 [Auricularia subglabra TFB-10046 SS5]